MHTSARVKEPSVQRSHGTPNTVTYGGLPGPAGWAVTKHGARGHLSVLAPLKVEEPAFQRAARLFKERRGGGGGGRATVPLRPKPRTNQHYDAAMHSAEPFLYISIRDYAMT